MSGHAGGHSEAVKPPVHPEIANDENVPPADAAEEGIADRDPTAVEGAGDNEQRSASA
jgi:hypothetical protein